MTPLRDSNSHILGEAMRSPWITPADSAMDSTQARRVIANDIVRRLERISKDLLEEEGEKALDNFNLKMIHSGYSTTDRLVITEDGFMQFFTRKEQRKKESAFL